MIKLMIKGFLVLMAINISENSFSQEWQDKMADPNVNFYEVLNSYEKQFEGKSYERGNGMKQFLRWKYFTEPRVYPSGNRMNSVSAYEEKIKFEKQNNFQRNKTANWQPLGPVTWTSSSYNPGNGRINAVRVDPNDSNRIYVGTPAGGCWKTTDGGQTWNPISDNLPVIGVTDIAINPNNSNEIYIATGDGFSGTTYSIGVLKSIDQGATWNATNLNFFRSQSVRSRRLAINPLDPSILWVATNAGLFKTRDGGNSWVSVLSGDVRNVKIKPGDTSVVYASTDQFYRSTDGGNTFSLSTGIANASSINRMEIAITNANANYVYAVTGSQSDASFEGLYLSINSGASFTKMSSSPNILAGASSGNGSGGQSWYDLAIAANHQNANEVYVGGINVWRSTNAGVNWTIKSHWTYPSNIGYTHADIHALEWYNGKIYCGSDGGVFSSTDNGDNWNNLSDGLQISQFYQMASTEANSEILMGGTQDNGCFYRDATGNWDHILGGDGMNVVIDRTNPNIVYYSWQNGGIHVSYNGGATGTNTTGSIRSVENGAWVTPFVQDPVSSVTMYSGFENVWKTTNRGASWSSISNFSGSNTIRQLKVAPSNNNYIYVAFNDNRIYRTTNGGNNWSLVNSGLPNRVITDIEIHPSYEDSIWVSFSGYFISSKVFVSGNAGTNWSNLSSNMPNLPVNDLAYDTVMHRIYAGTDIGVYYQQTATSLGWFDYNTGLPNVIVNELEINYGTDKIRAATYGRGMWETNLERPLSTGINSIESIKEEFSLSPNPGKDYTLLSWENNAPRRINLIDTKGRIIRRLIPNNGKSMRIDLSDLPTGLYFIEVENNRQLVSLKLIKN